MRSLSFELVRSFATQVAPDRQLQRLGALQVRGVVPEEAIATSHERHVVQEQLRGQDQYQLQAVAGTGSSSHRQ